MRIYDVAISFAGENRGVADSIARGLVLRGMNVFYDEYRRAELWGKDLYSHLTKVYKDDAKYCLMLISKEYAQKQWTSLERKAAQARAFSENAEYILPLRLDDTAIDGILPTTGYIDFRQVSLETVLDMIQNKVNTYNAINGIVATLVTAAEALHLAAVKAPEREFKDADITTTCPTCGTRQTLAEAMVALDDADTVYKCKNQCQTIVVISRPGLVPWPGRGYRIRDYVIRNSTDMFIQTDNMSHPLKLDASRCALMKVRPDGPMHSADVD